MPSYPPQVYYRDTYGLEHAHNDLKHSDSLTTDCSDDSITTKSTVKTMTMHAVHPMYTSQGSKMTNNTQSYHMEQLVTDHVMVRHPRSLLTLTLIMFASAVQLMIFSVICLFYDGCPYYVAPVLSVILFLNTLVVFIFLKYWPSRGLLYASCVAASLSLVESVFLFFWSAHLINQEDKYIDRLGARPNRIVASTRIAMYSMHMVFAPIHGVAALLCTYVLYTNLKTLGENTVTRAYFMTEPIGHQRILVPIEVRQVREMDSSDSLEAASIGVQTSGTRSQNI